MAYANYASITVDNTKVSGSSNLTNFPVLVSGTYDGTGGEPDIRTDANGGNVQNTDSAGGADGATTVPADLVFSPNTDGSSPYDFEIEKYDASTGEIIAWVEIPSLLYSSDTTFYMVYGDSSVTTSQEDINGTWGAYTHVWHMATMFDSASAGNHLTNDGTLDTPVKIGQGRDFDNNTDGLDLDSGISPGQTYTMMYWIKCDAGTPTNRVVMTATEPGPDGYLGFLYESNYLEVNNNGTRAQFTDYTSFTDLNLWTITQDTTNIKAYKNGGGTVQSLTQIGTWVNAITSFGNYPTGANFLGEIDEARFINGTALTADWITTEYNTQNSPSTFYTMGSEQSGAITAIPQRTLRGVGL